MSDYNPQSSVSLPDTSHDTYLQSKYGQNYNTYGHTLTGLWDSITGFFSGDNYSNWYNDQWNRYNAQVDALNQQNASLLGQVDQAKQAGYNPSALLSGGSSSYGVGSSSKPTALGHQQGNPLDVFGGLMNFAQMAAGFAQLRTNIEQNQANTSLIKEKAKSQEIENRWKEKINQATYNKLLAVIGNTRGKTYNMMFPVYASQNGPDLPKRFNGIFHDEMTGLDYNFRHMYRNPVYQNSIFQNQALKALTSVRYADVRYKNYYLNNIARQINEMYKTNNKMLKWEEEHKDSKWNWQKANMVVGNVTQTLKTLEGMVGMFMPKFGASVNGSTGEFSQWYGGFKPYNGGF